MPSIRKYPDKFPPNTKEWHKEAFRRLLEVKLRDKNLTIEDIAEVIITVIPEARIDLPLLTPPITEVPLFVPLYKKTVDLTNLTVMLPIKETK